MENSSTIGEVQTEGENSQMKKPTDVTRDVVPGRDASTMSHRLKLTCSHERLAAVKAMTGVLHPWGSHLNIRPGSILTMVLDDLIG